VVGQIVPQPRQKSNAAAVVHGRRTVRDQCRLRLRSQKQRAHHLCPSQRPPLFEPASGAWASRGRSFKSNTQSSSAAIKLALPPAAAVLSVIVCSEAKRIR
jgi:hypothetical protein